MTEVDDTKDKNEEETPDPADHGHLYVRFVSPGSVFFDFDMEGMVAMQMIVLGEYLSTMGKSQLLQEQARLQQDASSKQIQVARPGISPQLQRSILNK